MSKQQYKIQANDFTFNKNINIDLSQMFDFTRDEDISLFSDEEMQKNINPVVDREIKRFKASSPFDFNFSISGYTTYIPNIFSASNITNNDPQFYNSFWILDYYDSMKKNSQSKMFTNFYKPQRIISNGVIDSTIRIPIDGINDQSFVGIPRNFLSTTGLTECFIKFRFFNAKNGIIYNFKKSLNLNNTESDYYFKIILDINNKNWYIADGLNIMNNYSNPITNVMNQNSTPTLQTNDNKDKGSFINQDGKYQDGAIVDNTPC